MLWPFIDVRPEGDSSVEQIKQGKLLIIRNEGHVSNQRKLFITRTNIAGGNKLLWRNVATRNKTDLIFKKIKWTYSYSRKHS